MNELHVNCPKRNKTKKIVNFNCTVSLKNKKHLPIYLFISLLLFVCVFFTLHQHYNLHCIFQLAHIHNHYGTTETVLFSISLSSFINTEHLPGGARVTAHFRRLLGAIMIKYLAKCNKLDMIL